MPDTDIRLLDEQDRDALVDHLFGLDAEGRASRFMGSSSSEMAGRYASKLDFASTSVIGCFEADHLIGVAELHPNGQGGAEFAVSVDPDRRGPIARMRHRRDANSSDAFVPIQRWRYGDRTLPS